MATKAPAVNEYNEPRNLPDALHSLIGSAERVKLELSGGTKLEGVVSAISLENFRIGNSLVFVRHVSALRLPASLSTRKPLKFHEQTKATVPQKTTLPRPSLPETLPDLQNWASQARTVTVALASGGRLAGRLAVLSDGWLRIGDGLAPLASIAAISM